MYKHSNGNSRDRNPLEEFPYNCLCFDREIIQLCGSARHDIEQTENIKEFLSSRQKPELRAVSGADDINN